MLRSLAPPAILLVCACGGGGEGGGADAAPADAGLPDAAPVACEADHAEAEEPLNDLFAGGTPEETGQTLQAGGEAFTLCGAIDPAAAVEDRADADFYRFAVDGEEPVPLRAELRGPTELAGGPVFLELWTPARQLIGGGRLLGERALFAGFALPPGDYLISVRSGDAPAAPALYEVTVLENPNRCPPAEGEPDAAEADEAPGHRQNDMVAVSYAPAASIRETSADDRPEETGLTLAAGETYHLRGRSADVPADGDAYRDRDAFLVSTGPGADELEIRLAWPHDGTDVDMDFYLFAADDPDAELTGGKGTVVGSRQDELVTLPVEPEASYWLWAAAFDDEPEDAPVTYDVTICARTFPP